MATVRMVSTEIRNRALVDCFSSEKVVLFSTFAALKFFNGYESQIPHAATNH